MKSARNDYPFGKSKSFFAVLLIVYLFVSSCSDVQTSKHLPRSVPESEGVSSEQVLKFFEAADTSEHEFHSVMVVRHGKVIAEGWWSPYVPPLRHTLYSVSKSFTSTAVGFAISEGLMSVDDKVVSFFPEFLPDKASEYLSELKVKHLLTMSVGQRPEPTFNVISQDSNWVKAFLAVPIVDEPGTKFLYNSLGSYMLSAIVQKVTGEKVIDYLQTRLFDPLGIKGADWEVCPRGINTGGWGLRLKTEDLAKFGQLYLNKGKWNGKQVLPVGWAEEATTAHIQQHPEMSQEERDKSDWRQGYGYQFWRSRHNAFRADGAYGQYIINLPELDAVIAITAETHDLQGELNLVWNHLLPAFKESKLPFDEAAVRKLEAKLVSLELPVPVDSVKSNESSDISGKTFLLNKNDIDFNSISFVFDGDTCNVRIATPDKNYDLKFGSGFRMYGQTTKMGPSLVYAALAHYEGLPENEIVAGSYSWTKENKLQLELRYVESPHTELITCTFDENKIKLKSFHSLWNKVVYTINGELKE